MLVKGLLAWRATLPSFVKRLLVGYSGGRDSHVLLHSLWQCEQLAPRFSLRAVHVHHGLSPHADAWVTHCEQICCEASLPLIVQKVTLTLQEGESIENIARQARYQAIAQIMEPDEVLVTAHHMEDQAETVLLQLLRGAGPKGLSGMPVFKRFYSGWQARPFLDRSRKSMEHYAIENDLKWIDDESNDQLRFRRNFLRHRVMNVLEEMNPNYAACLARSAKHCSVLQSLLEDYLAEDLACCEIPEQGLSIVELKQYSPNRQREILRLWLSKQGYTVPSSKRLQTILEQMVSASNDAKPRVEWGQWQAIRVRGMIQVKAILIT